MNKFRRQYQKALSNYTPRRSQLIGIETVEGETIEMKVRRIMLSGDPIRDGAPEIFTERNDGVQSSYNIRTDRWELAAEAMDVVSKQQIAAREGKGKVIDLNADKDAGGESIQGKETK